MKKHTCFSKWIPHGDVDAVYDMQNIEWTCEGLGLSLVPDNLDHDKRSEYNLKLVWSDVLCYQVTKESYRPDLWISNPDDAWTFYMSQTSDFLKHFQKDNILAPERIYHFLIVGTNFIIDILSTEYPQIMFF
jgi:hypothetical protein